ncbi:BatD family protein [Paracoccus aestuariivivens]|uniref:Protein BatD n=1 Tax=Paracoccus aestuariivivens TaxID=1820333 RepID=A0A6L6J4P6_9RHOB|nr:BatD family protein [Paracoccus aestuariivivens]MTH77063.1 hypothetical protein [Paracoccus aestuariivivens]
MKWALVLILGLFALPLAAQEAATPIIEAQLEQAEVVPGQTVTLRLNILVPTWMPTPPELPSFEGPNLRVRLPPQKTTAISRQVNGETWSGISRRYLLTPMVPGQFILSPQEVGITYVGTDGQTPVTVAAQTEEMTLTGNLPKGAEGLDPFIAANALELTQDLSGPTTDLAPGTSVTRTVTAKIEGTSPIVLPELTTQFDLPAIRTYPASPEITESDGADTLSGTRVETETLMAVGGGQGSVPPVSIDWFNLKTGKVETATVPGFDISVTGPPAKSAQPKRAIGWKLIAIGLVLALVLLAVLRWSLPRARRIVHARKQHYLASEAYARKSLLAAISQKNYPLATKWLAIWRARLPRGETSASEQVSSSFARIGATIYRSASNSDSEAAWLDLARAVRETPTQTKQATKVLPQLNPGHHS